MHTDPESALVMLVAALGVDQLVGEYPRPLHPVVWLGRSVSLVCRAAPAAGWWRQLAFGAALALGMTTAGAGLALLALHLADGVPLGRILVGAFLLKASLALRELGEAARRVEQSLRHGDLDTARAALRSLCSRDPTDLDREELGGAAVESLAENASDSVVAPLFYFLLFGVPGACAYRVVNTLDAMVGYRGRFEALGKVPARFDDLANWLPARLTTALLLLAGWLRGGDVAEGWRILRRDANRTPSPNGGRPMSAMAGLLRVELTKKGAYSLGDPHHPLTPDTITQARLLMKLTGLLMGALCAVTLGMCWLLK